MSLESDGSTSLLPISDYLLSSDHESFVWDANGQETSEEWIGPVREVGLDLQKHKVFHHNNKEYTTPPLPFQHDGELGESGSTIVYRVRAPPGYEYRRPLALKVIVCKESTRPPGPDSNARRLALQEVRNMAAIRHPHIVVYVASFEDYCLQTRRLHINNRPHHRPRDVFNRTHQTIKKHILGIAMYPPAQCNLSAFMLECGDDTMHGWWKLPYLHTYFGCLAQAVAYLHRSSVRIRHKDIKPENVVIDQFGLPVLTDFGLSKHFQTGHHSDGPTAKTLKYADPEAIHETMRDERSDIFSLGCVYLEMATVIVGRTPRFAEDHLTGGATALGTAVVEFKYSEALEGLEAYLNKLGSIAEEALAKTTRREKQESLRAVMQILPVIGQMMHPDFNKRPYAQDLYPYFRHLYDVHGTPGPCVTCEEERQSGRYTPKGSQRSGRGSPTMLRRETFNSMLARRESVLVAQSQITHSHVSHSPTEVRGTM
ncbi:kinase-like domain-containing protein [Cercophora newfieldiana]|uniref:non-specific serine/threonine protein kinase n=1 Tax=Cercophora newfieldiana TaxID=92897 RepID=A0AA40CKU0_9PEZI|nr:kinase-like domain-containing protein [Cercophora newfieldiana]